MRRTAIATAVIAVAGTLVAGAPGASGMGAAGLDGPRGIGILPGTGRVVGENTGVISVVANGKATRIGRVPKQYIAPAVAVGKDRTVWALTAGADSVTKGAGTLYRFTPRSHHRKLVLNVQKWQGRHNPDPFPAEGNPKESNPFGLAALPDGSVLVADAANNSLIRVRRNGTAYEVARVKPRVITMPEGMTGDGMPPAGTPIPAEAVVTSVTVGADGAYYIGELRGFPGTPGTSQIWRIRPGAKGAVCKPVRPRVGACKRYVDGLTSVVGLAAGKGGAIYAVELSKMGWMSMEGGAPGAEVGALIRIGHDKSVRTELLPGKLVMPGGVAVGPRGHVFVTTPVMGPGRVVRAR
jgi:hypothetical protein